MAALAASLVLTDDEIILPPRYTVDGRPENVARETRRNLGHAIEDLTNEEIKQIADSAEAHKQSGQRIFLEVAYGEPVGTTDAVLHFKKMGDGITAAYTFYKDEEDGRDKRLLRELKRMEYLEKVIMPMLATTDRNNSIGVVQGMIRSSSAFVKGLQAVFKQVETLSKAIERGLQNKSEMPSAEQKTAAIQTIQATLSKLQPSAANHLAIKNMVQQQVDALLKNVATPVTVLRADVKATTAPISAVTARNTASATTAAVTTKTATAGATTATPTSALSSVLPRTPPSVQPASIKSVSTQPITRTVVNTVARPIASTLAPSQANTLATTRPSASLAASQVISNRFSVLTNPAIAQRVQVQLATAPLAARVTGTGATGTAAAASVASPLRNTASTAPLSSPQKAAPVTSSNKVSVATISNVAVSETAALRVVATNPELQRTPASAERSYFTVIESKAGQQVLNTLAQNIPAQNTPVQNTLPPGAPIQSQPIAVQPTLVQPVAQQIPSSLPAQAAVIQTAAQPALAQPATIQPVQPNAANNHTATTPSVGQPATVQSTPAVIATPPAKPQDVPSANNVTSTPAAQRPTGKQDAPRTHEPAKPEATKSLFGKAEPEKDDKKTDFKANAKSACEACTTKDCANCGVKTSTLFGVKTNTIPILRHIPEAALQKATKMFGINAGKCAGCAGGNCASCGAARVTSDTAKVSSRFANLTKTAPQPTPK